MALDPGNVEAMVGLARVDVTTWGCLYDRRLVSAVCGGRDDHNQGVVPRTEPCFGSRGFGRSCKYLRTAQLKASLNASRHWRWIAIWPALMLSSGSPSFFLVEAQKPKLTSTRHSAFLLATPWLHRWMLCVGLAKAQLGADAEAVVWLRRGLDANRNYSVAHFDLAAALARLG